MDGGFNTPWRAEYHFCREVQNKEKQAWKRTRTSLSQVSKEDHNAER